MVEIPTSADPPVPANKRHHRRWLLFSLCLLFVVVVAVAAAWIWAAKTYTASALIHVAADEPMVIPNGSTRTGLDIYKATQMQLLTSDFVLIGAQRKLPNLKVIAREEDPVRWLAKSLQVDCPGNAEIIRVSLTTPDKNDGAAIVQAVVDAYMVAVVDKERTRRANRLRELDSVCSEKDTELRRKWTDLKKLSEQLGSGGQTDNRLESLISDERRSLAELRRAEMRSELQLARAKHKLGGLAETSPEFKAAKAEADLAEVDLGFWRSKTASLLADIDNLQKRRDQEAHESIDVEMMRGEVESLKAITRALNDERQRLQIELNSAPRITVIQRAL
jgi:uncharacterized protein involved in exopolysaccharide biosynthesis